MVEVFKTDVPAKYFADLIIDELQKHFPAAKINFDLDDCDKILRVEARKIVVDDIMEQLKQIGFKCEVLR